MECHGGIISRWNDRLCHEKEPEQFVGVWEGKIVCKFIYSSTIIIIIDHNDL